MTGSTSVATAATLCVMALLAVVHAAVIPCPTSPEIDAAPHNVLVVNLTDPTNELTGPCAIKTSGGDPGGLLFGFASADQTLTLADLDVGSVTFDSLVQDNSQITTNSIQLRDTIRITGSACSGLTVVADNLHWNPASDLDDNTPIANVKTPFQIVNSDLDGATVRMNNVSRADVDTGGATVMMMLSGSAVRSSAITLANSQIIIGDGSHKAVLLSAFWDCDVTNSQLTFSEVDYLISADADGSGGYPQPVWGILHIRRGNYTNFDVLFDKGSIDFYHLERYSIPALLSLNGVDGFRNSSFIVQDTSSVWFNMLEFTSTAFFLKNSVAEDSRFIVEGCPNFNMTMRLNRIFGISNTFLKLEGATLTRSTVAVQNTSLLMSGSYTRRWIVCDDTNLRDVSIRFEYSNLTFLSGSGSGGSIGDAFWDRSGDNSVRNVSVRFDSVDWVWEGRTQTIFIDAESKFSEFSNFQLVLNRTNLVFQRGLMAFLVIGVQTDAVSILFQECRLDFATTVTGVLVKGPKHGLVDNVSVSFVDSNTSVNGGYFMLWDETRSADVSDKDDPSTNIALRFMGGSLLVSVTSVFTFIRSIKGSALENFTVLMDSTNISTEQDQKGIPIVFLQGGRISHSSFRIVNSNCSFLTKNADQAAWFFINEEGVGWLQHTVFEIIDSTFTYDGMFISSNDRLVRDMDGLKIAWVRSSITCMGTSVSGVTDIKAIGLFGTPPLNLNITVADVKFTMTMPGDLSRLLAKFHGFRFFQNLIVNCTVTFTRSTFLFAGEITPFGVSAIAGASLFTLDRRSINSHIEFSDTTIETNSLGAQMLELRDLSHSGTKFIGRNCTVSGGQMKVAFADISAAMEDCVFRLEGVTLITPSNFRDNDGSRVHLLLLFRRVERCQIFIEDLVVLSRRGRGKKDLLSFDAELTDTTVSVANVVADLWNIDDGGSAMLLRLSQGLNSVIELKNITADLHSKSDISIMAIVGSSGNGVQNVTFTLKDVKYNCTARNDACTTARLMTAGTYVDSTFAFENVDAFFNASQTIFIAQTEEFVNSTVAVRKCNYDVACYPLNPNCDHYFYGMLGGNAVGTAFQFDDVGVKSANAGNGLTFIQLSAVSEANVSVSRLSVGLHFLSSFEMLKATQLLRSDFTCVDCDLQVTATNVIRLFSVDSGHSYAKSKLTFDGGSIAFTSLEAMLFQLLGAHNDISVMLKNTTIDIVNQWPVVVFFTGQMVRMSLMIQDSNVTVNTSTTDEFAFLNNQFQGFGSTFVGMMGSKIQLISAGEYVALVSATDPGGNYENSDPGIHQVVLEGSTLDITAVNRTAIVWTETAPMLVDFTNVVARLSAAIEAHIVMASVNYSASWTLRQTKAERLDATLTAARCGVTKYAPLSGGTRIVVDGSTLAFNCPDVAVVDANRDSLRSDGSGELLHDMSDTLVTITHATTSFVLVKDDNVGGNYTFSNVSVDATSSPVAAIVVANGSAAPATRSNLTLSHVKLRGFSDVLRYLSGSSAASLPDFTLSCAFWNERRLTPPYFPGYPESRILFAPFSFDHQFNVICPESLTPTFSTSGTPSASSSITQSPSMTTSRSVTESQSQSATTSSSVSTSVSTSQTASLLNTASSSESQTRSDGSASMSETFALTKTESTTVSPSTTGSPSLTETFACSLNLTLRFPHGKIFVYDFKRDGKAELELVIQPPPPGRKPKHVVDKFGPIVRASLTWGEVSMGEVLPGGKVARLTILPPAHINRDTLGIFDEQETRLTVDPKSFDCEVMPNLIEAQTNFDFTLHKVERPIPMTTTNAFTVVSTVTSGAGSVAGNPTTVTQQMRIGAILSLGFCKFSHNDPIDISISPTQFSVGAPVGAYYRGAAMGNTFLMIMIIVFGMFVSLLRYNPAKGHTLWESLGVFHMPGVLIVPAAALVQGTATVAVALLLHGPMPTDGPTGVVALGVITIIVLLTIVQMVFMFGCKQVRRNVDEMPSGGWKLIMYRIYFSDQKWVDEPGSEGFKTHWMHIFADYRGGKNAYLAVELTTSLLIGCMDGVKMERHCKAVLYTTLTIMALQTTCAIILRPFITLYETTFHIALSVLTTLAMACMVISHHAPDIGFDVAGSYISVIIPMVAIVKAVLDGANILRWCVARYQKIMEARRTGIPLDDDDEDAAFLTAILSSWQRWRSKRREIPKTPPTPVPEEPTVKAISDDTLLSILEDPLLGDAPPEQEMAQLQESTAVVPPPVPVQDPPRKERYLLSAERREATLRELHRTSTSERQRQRPSRPSRVEKVAQKQAVVEVATQAVVKSTSAIVKELNEVEAAISKAKEIAATQPSPQLPLPPQSPRASPPPPQLAPQAATAAPPPVQSTTLPVAAPVASPATASQPARPAAQQQAAPVSRQPPAAPRQVSRAPVATSPAPITDQQRKTLHQLIDLAILQKRRNS